MSTSHAQPILLGVPYDAGSSFKRGPAGAPARIRQALRSPASNTYSEALIDVGDPAVLGDAGDVDCSPPGSVRESIERRVREVVSGGQRPLLLGGDHSITYPIMRGFLPRAQKLTLLQIDAHPDLYPEFEGDRFSHACPFARILEEGLVDHLVQVGIRTMSKAQLPNVERYAVEVIDMRAWSRGDRPQLDGPIYISLDIDGIDPAHAPGVSHPEPGGLSVRDVLTLIQGLNGPIAGADIVELNPENDPQGLTAIVCAKLVKEIASRMIEVG